MGSKTFSEGDKVRVLPGARYLAAGHVGEIGVVRGYQRDVPVVDFESEHGASIGVDAHSLELIAAATKKLEG